MTLKARLKKHYSATLMQSFKQFRWGAVLFFIGLVIIYAGSQSLQPSLAQELVILLGLMVLGVGFIIAILAQIRMLIGRLLIFWDKTPKS